MQSPLNTAEKNGQRVTQEKRNQSRKILNMLDSYTLNQCARGPRTFDKTKKNRDGRYRRDKIK